MMVGAYTTSAGGALLVIAIMLPVIGMLAIFALGLRRAELIAYLVLPAGLLIALAIAAEVARTGMAVTYVVGGWQPPLGIALRADGLSATSWS